MTPGLFLLAFAVVLVAWHSLVPALGTKPAGGAEKPSQPHDTE